MDSQESKNQREVDFETLSKEQIARDEGRKNYLYYDSLNIPTIGVGRNLRRGLSDQEVDFLFNNDWQEHYRELIDAFPWVASLDDARLGALINMAFNLGISKLKGFHSTLAAFKESRWEDAANHMLNSLWASQVKGRAVRLAEQVRTGQWR